MFGVSDLSKTPVPRRFRFLLADTRTWRWLVPLRRCFTFPFAVTRNLFFVPLCVFCFGIVSVLLLWLRAVFDCTVHWNSRPAISRKHEYLLWGYRADKPASSLLGWWFYFTNLFKLFDDMPHNSLALIDMGHFSTTENYWNGNLVLMAQESSRLVYFEFNIVFTRLWA